jgi:hypothetical protein
MLPRWLKAAVQWSSGLLPLALEGEAAFFAAEGERGASPFLQLILFLLLILTLAAQQRK